MRQFFPVEELARDERFNTITNRERMGDPRTVFQPTQQARNNNRLTPSRRDASDAARGLMHGIFVGEIQALEGAGRTCHDFDTSPAGAASTPDTVPFALKLDMAGRRGRGRMSRSV